MFICNQCGECCRHLDLSPLYSDLDRGDGVCRFLNGNLCSIYQERPLLCRVDESYEAFFSGVMRKEEYEKYNELVCQRLKQNANG